VTAPDIGAPGINDLCTATYRKDVKTSIWQVNGAVAPPKPYPDIGSLLSSLPADAVMRPVLDASAPGMAATTSPAAAGRLPAEQQNVVVPGYLCYVRKEGDNDYHLILGSTADASATYMTAEVSGLPSGGSDVDTLRQVRGQLAALLGFEPGTGDYHPVNPPKSVLVTGSLFFDGGHVPGEVGPDNAKTQQVWEIHPVTDLRAH
jgi:hypothetical protein